MADFAYTIWPDTLRYKHFGVQVNALNGSFTEYCYMLTKSDRASFRQCPRKFSLEHHRADLIPQNDPTLWRRANDGNIVGTKARELREHILHLGPPPPHPQLPPHFPF